MRRLVAVLSLAFVTAAFVGPASAAPASLQPNAAAFAGQWLASHVTAQGFIPQAADPSTPNLSATAQAVIALAAAGNPKYQELLTYLEAHVDEFVTNSGQSSNDDAGALSYLIMDAVIGHKDPTNFGASGTDLVARLQATKQPSGLFGASDPTFDGAFRQGLALMALHAVGISDPTATDWLAGQQCADFLWTSYRADTSTPCPAVDPNTFSGPDTNSTALAMLGLQAQGRVAPARDGGKALEGARNSGGGWGFLARSDQPTDANSTGVVLSALLAVFGGQDQLGTDALLALQADCGADAADVGGVAFQDLSSGPDVLATVQATPALAGAVLPLGPASDVKTDPVACAAPPAPKTSVTDPSTPTAPAVAGQPLPRTGSSSNAEVGIALVLMVVGVVLVQRADARRRRHA